MQTLLILALSIVILILATFIVGENITEAGTEENQKW